MVDMSMPPRPRPFPQWGTLRLPPHPGPLPRSGRGRLLPHPGPLRRWWTLRLPPHPALSPRWGRGGGSAVFAWGVVTGVHGIFQELFGLEGPELGNAGEGVDHRVLELAAHALDLAHVDVLHGIAIVVEADGAPGRIRQIDAAQGAEELLHALDVAPRRLEGGLEGETADVRALRVVGRYLLELGLVGLNELPVRGGGERS